MGIDAARSKRGRIVAVAHPSRQSVERVELHE